MRKSRSASRTATPLTFGSLFTGIGGMDLGLKRAGLVCRWQVEIDPYCQQILARHWPEVPKYGDIREVTGDGVERVDLICGGFPCQDVSCAREGRLGLAGARSGLWSEYLRLVRVLRPRYVLIENVAALLIPVDQWTEPPIATVLGNLAEIGFHAEWTVLRASQFGAHHHRARVFILAYAPGVGLASKLIHSGATPEVDIRMLGEFRLLRNGETVRPVPLSGIHGVVDGLSLPVDPFKGIGNAVFPAVAEWIGKRIVAFETGGLECAHSNSDTAL